MKINCLESNLFRKGVRSILSKSTNLFSTKGNTEYKYDTDNLIDGKKVAKNIRLKLRDNISELKDNFNIEPGLAVILVGERRDSATYVRMKKRACDEVGIKSYSFDYSVGVQEDEIINLIDDLNKDPKVHGILVQLPLPLHMDEEKVINNITPSKDVDGLHPNNFHKLVNNKLYAPRNEETSCFTNIDFHIACTPQGCIELLDNYDINIAGTQAVVVGRSNIVGIPLALLLMQRDATVTIAHSKTEDLSSIVNKADIVIAAVGQAGLIQGDWIKAGATIIDVGINSVDDSADSRGYKLVGDVDFESCKTKAGHITPVPGGVGPMTIAMLLRNTYQSAKRSVLNVKN